MKLFRKIIIPLVSITLGLAILGTGSLIGAYFYLAPKLPSIETLKDVRLQVPLRIYTRDHKLIAEFGEKRREPLKYADIPTTMVQAFLAAEDDRFFVHPGVDYQGLLRAAFKLLVTGERRQGGSTITMQVARNFFLSSKKTYARKLNEIFLSLKIERLLTKQEILELYLNKIYLGQRAYGVGAASMIYYGKPVEKLELYEIAMIAGLPKAPSRYNPISDPERALIRRDYVLGRLHKLGQISQDEYIQAINTPDTAELHLATTEVEAPYVAEMARKEATDRFGSGAYNDGYKIFTTIDSSKQEAANDALRRALHAYDKRHGYRGVSQHFKKEEDATFENVIAFLKKQPDFPDLTNALVLETREKDADLLLEDGSTLTLDWPGITWARTYRGQDHRGPELKTASEVIKSGDLVKILLDKDKEGNEYWRLAQVPDVSGAFVALSPDNGAILALVGGYDFSISKFNRVIQAKRQPGSGFKAFIYSAALEKGFTTASLINDAPVVFDDDKLESAWRPENYSGRFYGPTRLRYALTHSRNLVSIRLLRKIGIRDTLDYIARFGFNKDELPRDLSLSLGSGAISPLAMAEGYAVLANGGYHVKPYIIDRIEDDKDFVYYQAEPTQVCEDLSPERPQESLMQDDEPKIQCAERVITKQNHYLMNSMMRDVIQYGTAKSAKVLGRKDLAGKTGTTNDQRDAWFNGFSRRLVAVTWIGFDDFKPLGRGEVGGRAALPAWIDFMREALKNQPEELPELPPGMVTMRVDVDTGKPVGSGSQNAIFEVFREDHAPKLTFKGSSGLNLTTGQDAATLEPEEDPF
jgi:penicillin-binding protein 1A